MHKWIVFIFTFAQITLNFGQTKSVDASKLTMHEFDSLIFSNFPNERNTQKLGPWNCRSAATKNKWINGGFQPRVNDLLGPMNFSDSAIKASSALGEMDWNFQTTVNLTKKKYLHYNLHLGQSSIYHQVRINNKAINCNRYLSHGLAGFCGFSLGIDPSVLKDSGNVIRLNYYTPLDSERNIQWVTPNCCKIKDNDPTGFAAAQRKPPYEYGWDIAPRRVNIGLEEGVSLEGWNHYRLDYFNIQTISANADSAVLIIRIDIEADTAKPISIIFGIENYTIPFRIEGYPIKAGLNKFQREITLYKPKLWWPNGFYQQNGDTKPHLYKTWLQLAQPNDTFYTLKQFGIRTLKLENNNDKLGRNFQFVVNGKPIFIKGVNMVPTRGFLSEKQHDSLWIHGPMMQRIADANVNMVRIWGGGGYENDWFYDSCDKLGLMVWQDFMYSGMMYEQKYDQNLEAEYQVKRLSLHPSIALWCGNNEIEVAWKHWGWQNKYKIHGADSNYLWEQYEKIFYRMLPSKVMEYASKTAYIPTSPQSNWGNAKGLSFGDNHYWGLWHGEQSIDKLNENIPRFVSEWGLPSYPLSGFKGAETGDLQNNKNPLFAQLNKRMLSYKGIQLLHNYVDSFNSQFPDAQSYSYYPQSFQVQRYALHTGIAAHRSARPYCMGTMWWQLNDIWPGITWSILDFNGQPKPAYFQMKYDYNNLSVFNVKSDNYSMILTAVNDGWADSSITIYISSIQDIKVKLKTIKTLAKKSASTDILSITNYELNNLCKNMDDKLMIQVYCNGRVVYSHRYKPRFM